MQLRVPASRLSTIGVIIDITSMPVPQMAHHVSIIVFVRVGRILLIFFLTVFIFNIQARRLGGGGGGGGG